MFSFFKKKPKDAPPPVQEPAQPDSVTEAPADKLPVPPVEETVPSEGDSASAVVPPVTPAPAPTEQKKSWFSLFKSTPAVPEPIPEPIHDDVPQAHALPEAENPQVVRTPAIEVNEPVYAAEPEIEVEEPAIKVTQEDVEAEQAIVAAPIPEAVKKSWLTRLKTGLSKTSSNLTTLFVGAKIDEALYEELESALLMSDAGVEATDFLLTSLKRRVKEQRLTEAAQVKAALRVLLIDLLTPLQKPLVLGREQPMVMMIAGVNGAGKTTTIGKLAKHLQEYDQSVLLAAGDTFRAAAREQLMVWGDRNKITVISQESGDPAAVAFDAVHSAQARKIDVVMVDTAGRLPTQLHLMDELKKIKRVIGKGMASAPHEILLVIDGNTGQNALTQVKAFDDALGLTGLVVTKLDGTAKGGVLAAIVKARPIPVYFIGIGEKIEDLQPFNAEEFVDALLS